MRRGVRSALKLAGNLIDQCTIIDPRLLEFLESLCIGKTPEAFILMPNKVRYVNGRQTTNQDIEIGQQRYQQMIEYRESQLTTENSDD
jgi:hypothetical protein